MATEDEVSKGFSGKKKVSAVIIQFHPNFRDTKVIQNHHNRFSDQERLGKNN